VRLSLPIAAILTLAIAASVASGAHKGLASAGRAAWHKRPAAQIPSVAATAIERGCAAWGEPLSACLERPVSASSEGAAWRF
jgi:hypothetical protein